MRVKNVILFFLMFSLLGLTACGGGSSNNESTASTAVSADGVWGGTFTEKGVGTFDASALLYNGRILAISEKAGVVYDGNYTVSGSNISGSVKAYNITTKKSFATATISGTVSEQDSISMEFNTLYNDGYKTSGEISLSFNNIYNRTPSLSLVSGSWNYTNPSFGLTITIQDDGSFTGQNTDSCVVSGSIGIIDTKYNIYNVDVTVASCGVLNGNYTGISSLGDDATTNDTLLIIVSNDNYVLYYPFTRQ